MVSRRRTALFPLLAVMPLAATLAGCLQTAGGPAAASAGAAGGFRPVVDMASAPNGGAGFEQDLAKCQSLADKSAGGGANGAMMPAGTSSFLSTALQNVAVGAVNGGFSNGNAGSMLGSASVVGANAALQDQAAGKMQAAARQQDPAASPQAQYVRDCMKTYCYTVRQ
jgi:hypothetical protein